MTKPLIPLALGIVLLGGCATMDAFNSLQKTVQEQGITIARAFTLTNKAHVYLTWFRPNGKIKEISRYRGSSFEVTFTPASGVSFVEDLSEPPVLTGMNYSYDLKFDDDSKVTRSISPIDAISETAQLLKPDNDPLGQSKLSTRKPTFEWQRLNPSLDSKKALAYMITVAELDPGSFSDPNNIKFTPTTANVKYSALIDPAKHSSGSAVSIEMGAKSDIPLATELLDAMKGDAAVLQTKDGDKTVPLEANKFYAWTVTPIVYTTDQTAFALGNMQTPRFFQVQ
ncbi:MAG TPA: hypothetical protein DD435_13965 [Cyanobacteria bacterium UBA8530]|nr:hypothetical protein [Cyanobacteria bacterium UBA8530]